VTLEVAVGLSSQLQWNENAPQRAQNLLLTSQTKKVHLECELDFLKELYIGVSAA